MKRAHTLFAIALFVCLTCLFSGNRADAQMGNVGGNAGDAGGATTSGGADETKIRRLLDVSGSAAIGKTMTDQMMNSFRQTATDVPAEFWDEMAKEIRPESFVAMMIPIYQRHFSSPEIDQLIAFYESPIGRKLVAEQPGIMQDSMGAGQKWGQDIAMRVQQKLQARRQGGR